MILLVRLALAALLLATLVWVRAGRPGVDRLPARHRRLARNLPLLAAPFLLLVVAWGLVGARGPRGLSQ